MFHGIEIATSTEAKEILKRSFAALQYSPNKEALINKIVQIIDNYPELDLNEEITSGKESVSEGTFLHIAVKLEDMRITDLLLSKLLKECNLTQEQINQKVQEIRSESEEKRSSPTEDIVLEVMKETKKQIREKINKKDLNGNTPLHVATFVGNVAAVKILLDLGADVNMINKRGETPLVYAVRQGNEEIEELLQMRGADYKVKPESGESPEQIIARRKALAPKGKPDASVTPEVSRSALLKRPSKKSTVSGESTSEEAEPPTTPGVAETWGKHFRGPVSQVLKQVLANGEVIVGSVKEGVSSSDVAQGVANRASDVAINASKMARNAVEGLQELIFKR